MPFWPCKMVCNKQSIASKPRHWRDMKAGRSNPQALGTSSPKVFSYGIHSFGNKGFEWKIVQICFKLSWWVLIKWSGIQTKGALSICHLLAIPIWRINYSMCGSLFSDLSSDLHHLMPKRICSRPPLPT